LTEITLKPKKVAGWNRQKETSWVFELQCPATEKITLSLSSIKNLQGTDVAKKKESGLHPENWVGQATKEDGRGIIAQKTYDEA